MSIVRAKAPFSFVDHAGVPRMVKAGDLFDSADPVAVKRAGLFESVEVAAAARATETASAAPGEVRARKSPVKRAPEPADAGTDD